MRDCNCYLVSRIVLRTVGLNGGDRGESRRKWEIEG